MFSLVLTNCSREELMSDTEVEIEVPPPVEIEVAELNGVVKDNFGQLIPSATVELFLESEIVATTTTNTDGSFIFYDVFVEDGYRIFAEKDDFHGAVTTVEEDHFMSDDVELSLLPIETAIGNSEDFGLENAENLVLISGRIVNEEGEGVNGFLMHFYENFTQPTFNATLVIDGYFEIFVLRGQEFQWSGDLQSCGDLFEVFTAIENVFFEDTELGIITISQESSSILVSGQIFDCDNELYFGDAIIEVWSDGILHTFEVTGPDYEINVPNCFNFGQLDFRFYTESNPFGGIETTVYYNQGQDNIQFDFSACNLSNTEFGYGNIFFGTDSIGITVVQANSYGNQFVIGGFSTDFPLYTVAFEFQASGIGEYEVQDFVFLDLLDGTTYFSEEMTFTVLEFPTTLPGTMRGFIEGKVIHELSGEEFDFLGFFEAEFN